VDFLRAELDVGPRPAKEIRKAAADAGVSPRTLDRAKAALKVTSEREGGIADKGQWFWRLPGTPTKDAKPMADLGETEVGTLSESGSTMRVSDPSQSLSGPYQRYDALSDPESDSDPLQADLDYYRGQRDRYGDENEGGCDPLPSLRPSLSLCGLHVRRPATELHLCAFCANEWLLLRDLIGVSNNPLRHEAEAFPGALRAWRVAWEPQV
jgi:hypothetical protein